MDLPGLEASSVLFSSSSGISGCQLPQMQWEGAWEGQVPIVGAALLEAGGRHCGSCFRIGGRLAKGKIWKAGTDECVGECVSVCVCLSGGFWLLAQATQGALLSWAILPSSCHHLHMSGALFKGRALFLMSIPTAGTGGPS